MNTENMTILIVGNGAREHALADKIKWSPRVRKVLCTPGNAGFRDEQLRAVKETDIDGIIHLALNENVELVVVGPEVPLENGLVNRLADKGIAAFGPTAPMSILEGSKVFTKSLCRLYGIPTSRFYYANSMADAMHAIRSFYTPPVIKADGLCAGKGVVVAKSRAEAVDAAEAMLVHEMHGKAGESILIEERLVGRECSVMAFCADETAILLPPARDYKRALDGDEGPNTGGMGSYSPLPDVDDALLERIKQEIFLPMLRAFRVNEGISYRGLLYAGLMLTTEGPKLIEFNVRFGDPETQVILARTESDIVDYMLATLEKGGLAKLPPIEVSPNAAVCVVIAAEGYPGKYNTGMWVSGDDSNYKNVKVYHAGTDRPYLQTRTRGGRILSIVGTGATIPDARAAAYDAANQIRISNTYFRRDIAEGVE